MTDSHDQQISPEAAFDIAATLIPPAQDTGFKAEYIPQHLRQPVPANDPIGHNIVRVFAYRGNEPTPRKAGTGVLISPDLLVTAAHVLFDAATFTPQRAGGYAGYVSLHSDALPIPQAIAATARIVAAPGYARQNPPRPWEDIALIKLGGPLAGVQPLVPVAIQPAQLQGRPVRIYGYPEYQQTPWRGDGTCVALRRDLCFHTCDASEGQSGGALLLMPDAQFFAVHRAGPAATPPDLPPSCGSVLLTQGAVNWINSIGPKL